MSDIRRFAIKFLASPYTAEFNHSLVQEFQEIEEVGQ